MKNLTELLDRPIAFHRPLVGVAGGVLSALMLSQALYWSKRTFDPQGWFWKTQAEWEEETGMGRREQETARARLRQTRFWKEELRGIPAKMHFRVDLDLLAANLLGDTCQASMTDSAILDWRNAPYKKGAKRQTRKAESAKHNTESTSETTAKTTPENTHTGPRVCDDPIGQVPGVEAEVPSDMGATLTGNPADQGQDLVETVFQNVLQAGQEIRNPAAYKAALARAAARGELVAPRTDVGAAAAQAWDTYASAYELRYGVAPVRNARVNAQLGQLVSRLGADEAKHVAAWYVGHNGALYVRTKHPVGLLLRDAEGLHTEWRRRQQVTETDARHVDRRQATANAFAPLLEEAEREANEGCH